MSGKTRPNKGLGSNFHLTTQRERCGSLPESKVPYIKRGAEGKGFGDTRKRTLRMTKSSASVHTVTVGD